MPFADVIEPALIDTAPATCWRPSPKVGLDLSHAALQPRLAILEGGIQHATLCRLDRPSTNQLAAVGDIENGSAVA
jgi:hypothetical protein